MSDDPRQSYMDAKSTLAIVISPPSKRKLQPIPPSADWRFDLAEGCPAHCQYCYLAGSLSGPPVTRVYANIEEILMACLSMSDAAISHPHPRRAPMKAQPMKARATPIQWVSNILRARSPRPSLISAHGKHRCSYASRRSTGISIHCSPLHTTITGASASQ